VTFFTGARSHVAMINAFGIHPSCHGKGRGSEMLAATESFIKTDKNITQIELAYEGDNKVGQNFYEKKFGYQQQLNYEDWWRRGEPEFQKKYPWYTDERCCVKYLTEEKRDSALPITSCLPMQNYEDSAIDHFDHSQDIAEMLSSYTREEQDEIKRMLSKEHQEAYVLKGNGIVEALICFKSYQGEKRLAHAVTIPCVIFNSTVSNETVASFVNGAMKEYREKNPDVFHFACSEEDTEDLFYANQHSKVKQLGTVLQLAGFKFKGMFQNYFSETSFAGRNLLGFECCFLDMNSAVECTNVSNNLTVTEKLKLVELLKDKEKISRHEQWDIYLMVRYVAYPQDYTPEKIIGKINMCKTSHTELKEVLLTIVDKKCRNQPTPKYMADPVRRTVRFDSSHPSRVYSKIL
jgi:hypothetical protein